MEHVRFPPDLLRPVLRERPEAQCQQEKFFGRDALYTGGLVATPSCVQCCYMTLETLEDLIDDLQAKPRQHRSGLSHGCTAT